MFGGLDRPSKLLLHSQKYLVIMLFRPDLHALARDLLAVNMQRGEYICAIICSMHAPAVKAIKEADYYKR